MNGDDAELNAEEQANNQYRYQIQVKAVERRFDPFKFFVSMFKTFVTIAISVLVAFIGGLGTLPLVILGFLTYLTAELFDCIENWQTRQNLLYNEYQLRYLVERHNRIFQHDQINYAETGTFDDNGYMLYHPFEHSRVIGKNWYNPENLFVTSTHLLAAVFAFVMAVVQLSKDSNPDDNTIFHPSLWSYMSLAAGVIAIILDPIEKHIVKANLNRTKDTLKDAIAAFSRPVAEDRLEARNKNLGERSKSCKSEEGCKKIADVEYRQLQRVQNGEIETINTLPDKIKIPPSKYQFVRSTTRHDEHQPHHIVEIVDLAPLPPNNIGMFALPALNEDVAPKRTQAGLPLAFQK